ncbi:MAG: hypothetical protein PHQ19_08805, partial [Candidatus Krumholzibacteria bacterium]|nr:hypothetical protein [Candidatus Krumholzibacteria bacterium]
MGTFDAESGYGSAWVFANNRPGGYLRYHTGNSERMRIAGTGEVGIGAPQPLAPLHVRNYDVQTPASALHSTDLVVESQDAVLDLYSAPSGSYGSCPSFGEVLGGALANKWSIIRQTAVGGNGLLFTFGPNADPVTNDNIVYLDDNGEVGIGTTNPGAAFEVAGQVKITGGSPGAGKVLTSDASGLASWEPVTAECWFSPWQIIGTELGGVEIEPAAEGYIEVSRSSAAGWAVLYFYLDLPGKISGRQQRIQSVTFHFMMPEWSEWVKNIYVKRLNTDGTSTTIYSDTGLYLQEHSWSSSACTDADPDPITGPVSLRLDIDYSNPGPGFHVCIGSIKV